MKPECVRVHMKSQCLGEGDRQSPVSYWPARVLNQRTLDSRRAEYTQHWPIASTYTPTQTHVHPYTHTHTPFRLSGHDA